MSEVTMPWGPEDWNAWLPVPTSTLAGELDHLQSTRILLGTLPDREHRVVADASGVLVSRWPHLADSFARVLPFPPERSRTATCSPSGRRRSGVDVVLIVDLDPCPGRQRLRALFEQARVHLSEGGWLLATLPARAVPRPPLVPFAMPLAPDEGDEPGRFHPVEAQYLLSRAGYQGVRIRRVSGGAEGAGMLLCVATRRTGN